MLGVAQAELVAVFNNYSYGHFYMQNGNLLTLYSRGWFNKSSENYINTADSITMSCLWLASLFNAQLIKF